jgi:hypothetical protein
MAPGIFGFLEKEEVIIFCVMRGFWWREEAKEPQAESIQFPANQLF